MLSEPAETFFSLSAGQEKGGKSSVAFLWSTRWTKRGQAERIEAGHEKEEEERWEVEEFGNLMRLTNPQFNGILMGKDGKWCWGKD